MAEIRKNDDVLLSSGAGPDAGAAAWSRSAPGRHAGARRAQHAGELPGRDLGGLGDPRGIQRGVGASVLDGPRDDRQVVRSRGLGRQQRTQMLHQPVLERFRIRGNAMHRSAHPLGHGTGRRRLARSIAGRAREAEHPRLRERPECPQLGSDSAWCRSQLLSGSSPAAEAVENRRMPGARGELITDGPSEHRDER